MIDSDIAKICVFNVPYVVNLAIAVVVVDIDASGRQIGGTDAPRTRRLLRRAVTHQGGGFDRPSSRMEVIGGRKEGTHCAR
jgi:hypothetical protein